MKGRAGVNGTAGSRAFRVMLLALPVFFAGFAAPDAARAASMSLSVAQDAAGGNNGYIGEITVNQGNTWASANVYYLKGRAVPADVKVKIGGSGFPANEPIGISVASDASWRVEPARIRADGGGEFDEEVLTLTRTDAEPFMTPENVTISAEGVEGVLVVVAVPVEVDPKLDRDRVTFYRGVSDTRTVTASDGAGAPPDIALSGVTLAASGTDIPAPGNLWPGDDAVTADVSAGAIRLTAANPRTRHAPLPLDVRAAGVGVTSDTVAGSASTPVAVGETPFGVGTFQVEVVDPYVSPDLTARIFRVGEAVTAPSGYDFAVAAMPSPEAEISGISAGGAGAAGEAGTNSQSFGGLTAALSDAGDSVGFSGTPQAAGEWTFWIVGRTAGTSTGLTPGKLTVTVVSRDVAALRVCPSTLTLAAGVAVSGAALEVIGSPRPSSLTINERGADGRGGASVEWNGLTFDVSSANRVSVAGVPASAGARAFTLTGTSAAGAAFDDFTVTVTEAGAAAPVSFDAPAVYDESGDRVERLIPGARMRIVFRADARISDVRVRVAKPGGLADDALDALDAHEAEARDGDGYLVSHPAPGTTDVTVYYRPAGGGGHTFTIGYAYGGGTGSFRTAIDSNPWRAGGGGSCDAGFGAPALLMMFGGGLLPILGRGSRAAARSRRRTGKTGGRV